MKSFKYVRIRNTSPMTMPGTDRNQGRKRESIRAFWKLHLLSLLIFKTGFNEVLLKARIAKIRHLLGVSVAQKSPPLIYLSPCWPRNGGKLLLFPSFERFTQCCIISVKCLWRFNGFTAGISWSGFRLPLLHFHGPPTNPFPANRICGGSRINR